MQVFVETAYLQLQTRATICLPGRLVCLLQLLDFYMALLRVPTVVILHHAPSDLAIGVNVINSVCSPYLRALFILQHKKGNMEQ